VLLAAGAHMNVRNMRGETPLLLAVRAGRLSAVRELLHACTDGTPAAFRETVSTVSDQVLVL
jgi:ankyrin repeat protein